MNSPTTRRISISMDNIWAGSGNLRDGIIEDCGAQFCDDNDASMECYEKIEAAIAEGKDTITVDLDGEDRELSWIISE